MAQRPLIVVTGGSSGIGLALARRLRRPDADLLLVARGADRLAVAAAELGCATLAADLATEQGVAALAERIAGVARIPVLVNNAGGPFRTPLLEHDPDEARAAIDLLYLAMVRVTAAAWPALVAARGSVINVVSVAGTVSTGSAPHYAAAKHAAIAWSRGLHVEAAAEGVHVLTANPGPVATTAFPHDRLRGHRWLRHAVIEDERCADTIVRAWARRRAESFHPEWWRVATVAQALAPATMARLARRGRQRFG
ncbi:MAG: SDR family NAD(P)-dependent oxidoreductase [Gaiellales bacterium]